MTAETNTETKMGDKIVMPKNAKLIGHVTHAAARSKGDAPMSNEIAETSRRENKLNKGVKRSSRAAPRRGTTNSDDPKARLSER